jgi:hypothetical protein
MDLLSMQPGDLSKTTSMKTTDPIARTPTAKWFYQGSVDNDDADDDRYKSIAQPKNSAIATFGTLRLGVQENWSKLLVEAELFNTLCGPRTYIKPTESLRIATWRWTENMNRRIEWERNAMLWLWLMEVEKKENRLKKERTVKKPLQRRTSSGSWVGGLGEECSSGSGTEATQSLERQ